MQAPNVASRSPRSKTAAIWAQYAAAESAAIEEALQNGSDLTRAHRDLIAAHFGFLLSRIPESEAQAFVALLAGMVGMRSGAHRIPYDAPLEDATDWGSL